MYFQLDNLIFSERIKRQQDKEFLLQWPVLELSLEGQFSSKEY